YKQPFEGEDSYAENAAIKARWLQGQLREAGIQGAVLADDSGIEVDVLGGRPGVLSARYVSKDASWPDRRRQLLRELDGVPEEKRGAKFVCAMMLILDDGTELAGYGEVEGSIAEREHGEGGFGYDPIFWYAPAGRTFAQLAEEEKNAVSHRRRAADDLLAMLRQRG
ncbi:MAG TPA: non-canonical purine NTP pyrophosphatase, partial [Candidatus Rubrimentiphilum sp.]|nr:non-canonical purine NTP pyrophosphatase [Candidatus Rubrimentiphilum sp.]